ncbi:helix-turn-helix domain-containing protein [Quadrisphaera sp. INWT6]|nr:helix-turn-helix domain-containing protein [Quadrisphaera sp. INWT6]
MMVTDAGQRDGTSPNSADVYETSALLSGLSGIRRHGMGRLSAVFQSAGCGFEPHGAHRLTVLFRVLLDAPWMREHTVAEQRYNAVHAVLFDGRTITDVAAATGVSRQSLHTWLARYEAGGIDALANCTSRPRTSPIQMPTHVEAAVIQLRSRRHRPPHLGRAPHPVRAAHPRAGHRHRPAQRVRDLPRPRTGRPDRPRHPPPPQPGLEARGTRPPDGAVADGPGGGGALPDGTSARVTRPGFARSLRADGQRSVTGRRSSLSSWSESVPEHEGHEAVLLTPPIEVLASVLSGNSEDLLTVLRGGGLLQCPVHQGA